IDYAHFQYIAPPYKNCRQIVTTHDVIFNDYPSEFSFSYRLIKNLLFGVSARRADIISTVSTFSKRSIQKYLNVKQQIIVTPNGVNDSFYNDFDRKASKEHILRKF